MTKIKLIIIFSMIAVFSIFSGMQVADYMVRSWFTGFILTLIFFTAVFLIQTLYYIAASKKLVSTGELKIKDYQSPLDIWLICIPFCVLMVMSYWLLGWCLVQVFICTSFALIGMLLGNALGRGSRKWSLRKSFPFFFGVIASTLFAMLMEWMV
ncbi:MAG: hypothetical protein R3232_04880 [Clostridia bacterium]|nr:hypothetical protein [Clostridia bacterium]